MTYPLITVPFLILTAAVTLLSARRPRFRRRMAASAIAAVLLVALTAIFDNLMIAAELFTYPETHISGLRVGLAPIEDFTYPLCAAFGMPAVYALLTRPPPAGVDPA